MIADENDKIQLPMYFASPLKEFPLELVIGARGQKNESDGGYLAEKEVWRCAKEDHTQYQSAVFKRCRLELSIGITADSASADHKNSSFFTAACKHSQRYKRQRFAYEYTPRRVSIYSALRVSVKKLLPVS